MRMERNRWVMKQEGISGGRLAKLRPVLCAVMLMAVCLLFSGVAEANYKDPARIRLTEGRRLTGNGVILSCMSQIPGHGFTISTM